MRHTTAAGLPSAAAGPPEVAGGVAATILEMAEAAPAPAPTADADEEDHHALAPRRLEGDLSGLRTLLEHGVHGELFADTALFTAAQHGQLA